MRRAAWLALALGSLAAAPASRAGDFVLGAAGGYFNLSGSPDSARAVFGSTGGATFGGDLGYVHRGRFFLSAGARVFQKKGERAFVADAGSPVFRLGHPLKLRLLPVQGTLGYRFAGRRLLGLSLTPYLGVGGGVTLYREESTVAGVRERQSFAKAGGHGLAGVELGGGRLRFAVEGQYSSFPDAIGVAGVSRVYREDDVGGFTVLGRVVFTTAR